MNVRARGVRVILFLVWLSLRYYVEVEVESLGCRVQDLAFANFATRVN